MFPEFFRLSARLSMGMVFYKHSLIGQLFGITGFMGMIFRNFSGFMNCTFYDLNGRSWITLEWHILRFEWLVSSKLK